MYPEEFLEIAEELARWKPHNVDEVCSRTIANRAYIGALMVSAVCLQYSLSITIPRSSDFYTNVEEELGRAIGHRASRRLAQLRLLRLDADYGLEIPFSVSASKESLILANDLIAMVKEKI